MDSTAILEGYLIKSPPDRKPQGPFNKLFKSKWRRRWFVLYAPLASLSLPGTRAALDYYNNERRHKKVGSVDLDHCDEVLCRLDSSFYKYVFSLKTKHKGRDRTYYLVADSEALMMKWVDCLCLALGLKENEEPATQTNADPQIQLQPNPSTAPQPQRSPQVTSRAQDQQEQAALRAQQEQVALRAQQEQATFRAQQEQAAALRTQLQLEQQQQLLEYQLQLQQQQQASPNYIDIPRDNKALNDANHISHNKTIEHHHDCPQKDIKEAYIQLGDCYTGDRQPVGPPGGELGDKHADHRASVDSIPPEPPPAPPQKMGRKLPEDTPSTVQSYYDTPLRDYSKLDNNENLCKQTKTHNDLQVGLPESDDDQEGIYKVPRDLSDEEGIYKLPRGNSSDEEGIYKLPRGNDSDEEGIYKMPRSYDGKDPLLRIYSDDDCDEHDEGIYKVPKGGSLEEESILDILPVFDKSHINERDRLPKSVVEEEDIYKVPPRKHSPPAPHRQTSDIYSVPPNNAAVEGVSVEDMYDVPPSHHPRRVSKPERHSSWSTEQPSAGDLYDVPRAAAQSHHDYRTSSTLSRISTANFPDHPGRKTVSENNLLESVVPPPSKSHVGPPPITESRYENLPPSNSAYPGDGSMRRRHPVPALDYQNLTADDTYDIPPPHGHLTDSDKMTMSPPPPKPCLPAKHSYINAPALFIPGQQDSSGIGMGSPVPLQSCGAAGAHESFYLPMSQEPADPRQSVITTQDVYTDMKSMAAQQLYASAPSNRPVNPSVHDVVPPPHKGVQEHRDDTYSIFSTHRTRSFKRNIPLSRTGEVVLPTRRTARVSSDEDTTDDDDSNSDSHDRSGDSIGYRTLPHLTNLMNCTPPPPKHHGEVHYLDLALDEHADPEKSPLTARPTMPGNISPTDYKEIDFVKTKALNEMTKDRESKRKSSEKSVDE